MRGLAELHGGKVEAHSGSPGTGSEFVIRLPLAKVPAVLIEVQAADVPLAANLRVVMDDNADAADSLAMCSNSKAITCARQATASPACN